MARTTTTSVRAMSTPESQARPRLAEALRALGVEDLEMVEGGAPADVHGQSQ